MVQPTASPSRMAIPTAALFTTGNVPGIPKLRGSTAEFGSASTLSTTTQPLNILEAVIISACISRPIIASYIAFSCQLSAISLATDN